MTTTIRADEQTFVPAPSDLRATTDRLLHAMTEAGLDDPRWEVAGPIVTAAAQLLREALGTPSQVTCVFVPAVVREADFASAARPLLTDAAVVDEGAARMFVRLSFEAALALS